MDASKVKNMLTDQNIIDLLQELQGEPRQKGKTIFAKTICHHGDSHKLVYYPDKKVFHCYSGCNRSYDVFSLVEEVLKMNFIEALRYVCARFGISFSTEKKSDVHSQLSFLKKLERKQAEVYELENLPPTILNSYYELFHKSWVDEGISPRSMEKFNIRFSIADNQIIIPHYDAEGNLIGVRARNMDKELVAEGMKYIPVRRNQKVLKHPTGAALYGLNFNKVHMEQYKTIVLFEAEKSVLQLDTIWPDKSIGACVSGSALSKFQIDLMLSMNIEEVVLAPDKEFRTIEEEKFYIEKIRSTFIDNLGPYFQCSVIWDKKNLLDEKMSPTDKGKEVFEKLWNERIDMYSFSAENLIKEDEGGNN